jgi:hypothetical protein
MLYWKYIQKDNKNEGNNQTRNTTRWEYDSLGYKWIISDYDVSVAMFMLSYIVFLLSYRGVVPLNRDKTWRSILWNQFIIKLSMIKKLQHQNRLALCHLYSASHWTRALRMIIIDTITIRK